MKTVNVISVACNCSEYVQMLYHSLLETTTGPFNFHITDHSDIKYDIKAIRSMEREYPGFFVYPRKQDSTSWSINHGAGLNYAISKLNDEDIAIIMEIDSFMFMKGWNETLIRDIEDGSYDVATTVRPFCENPKFIDQPMAYISSFIKRTISLKNIDFLPLYKLEVHSKKLDKHEMGFFDVGHKLEILPKIKKIEIVQPSIILNPIKDILTKYKGSQDYLYDGELISTHVRAGGMGSHKEKNKFNDIIEYLKSKRISR